MAAREGVTRGWDVGVSLTRLSVLCGVPAYKLIETHFFIRGEYEFLGTSNPLLQSESKA